MPSISGMSVPKRAYPALKLLASMDDAGFRQLSEKFAEESTGAASPRSLAQQIDGAAPGVDGESSKELIAMLVNLSALHFTHGWSLPEIGKVIENTADIGFEESERTVISQRLITLLSSSQVGGIAKATDIAYEHPATFHNARIVSDIRPVFGDDATDDPLGAVITHTLNVDYFDRKGHEALYVTLTTEELAELATVIERAQRKSASIRRLIETSGLREFDATFE